MCGRFTISFTVGFADRFKVRIPEPLPPPRYNVAPSQQVPVIICGTGGNREIVEMQWGLLPAWSHDPASSHRPINARAEALSKRPAFRSLVMHRRCLVPATGFYEWQKTGKRRLPHYIHRKDGDYITFAGLYDIWEPPASMPHISFAIVTTEPNDAVIPYHDRMPAILRESDEACWLSPGPIPDYELQKMLAPYPSGLLESWQVSGLVNNPDHDGAELIARQKDINSFL
jgi:putative SOS response-associated peptidase YedK